MLNSTHLLVVTVVSSEISGEIFPAEIYSSLSGNLLKNFFHFVRFDCNHIKISNKLFLEKQLSRSLCFNFVHYVQKE